MANKELAPISEIVESALEPLREIDGYGREMFLWLHAGDDVKEENKVSNSTETDPASGDLKPVYTTSLFCATHQVSSAPEEFKGK